MSDTLTGAPVRAVLFDYGNTLITVRRPQASLERAYEGIASYLSRRHGDAVPAASVLLNSVHDRVEAEVMAHDQGGTLEEMDLAGAATRAYAELGLAISAADLDELFRVEQEAWWEGVVVAPDVRDVLLVLRGAGVRTAICSNAPYHHESLMAQLRHVGLAELLDGATFSSKVGWRKPSPRIFETALGELGVPAAAAVMVGDTVRTDIAGAQAAGMRAVLLREHRDDQGGGAVPDAVIDRLVELPALVAVSRSSL